MKQKHKTLNISKVPAEVVRLAWLSFLMEDYDVLAMTKRQLGYLSHGIPWTTYRGKPIKIIKENRNEENN